MKRYYVYKWALDDYILIDRETMELSFFKTNYQRIITDYFIENPKKSKLTKAKITGLIKRLNGSYSLENAYVIDKYMYHLLMNEQQREKCKGREYHLNIKESDFITSGNDYQEVITAMQLKVNGRVRQLA